MKTDGSGNLDFIDPSTISGNTNKINDSDNTTNIEILEDEKIKMKINDSSDVIVYSKPTTDLIQEITADNYEINLKTDD
jgi:hypothetical protein